MGDLLVDTDVLHDAGRSLRRVYEDFKSAGDDARPPESVIAHGRLRERLEEFADNWDNRRREMTKDIEGLGELAEGAATEYERLETELARALEGQA